MQIRVDTAPLHVFCAQSAYNVRRVRRQSLSLNLHGYLRLIYYTTSVLRLTETEV